MNIFAVTPDVWLIILGFLPKEQIFDLMLLCKDARAFFTQDAFWSYETRFLRRIPGKFYKCFQHSDKRTHVPKLNFRQTLLWIKAQKSLIYFNLMNPLYWQSPLIVSTIVSQYPNQYESYVHRIPRSVVKSERFLRCLMDKRPYCFLSLLDSVDCDPNIVIDCLESGKVSILYGFTDRYHDNSRIVELVKQINSDFVVRYHS